MRKQGVGSFAVLLIEFAYRGALHQVKNPAEVILIEEKRPTERSDNRFEELYLFCDGHVQFYPTSDGNFDDWEQQRSATEALTPASQ